MRGRSIAAFGSSAADPPHFCILRQLEQLWGRWSKPNFDAVYDDADSAIGAVSNRPPSNAAGQNKALLLHCAVIREPTEVSAGLAIDIGATLFLPI
jgi:hypothetical protein